MSSDTFVAIKALLRKSFHDNNMWYCKIMSYIEVVRHLLRGYTIEAVISQAAEELVS